MKQFFLGGVRGQGDVVQEGRSLHKGGSRVQEWGVVGGW